MKKLILLLVVFITACAPSVQQPSVVLPEILAPATAYIDPSYPSAQVELAAPNQTASGIEVRMERAAVDGKNVNADVLLYIARHIGLVDLVCEFELRWDSCAGIWHDPSKPSRTSEWAGRPAL